MIRWVLKQRPPVRTILGLERISGEPPRSAAGSTDKASAGDDRSFRYGFRFGTAYYSNHGRRTNLFCLYEGKSIFAKRFVIRREPRTNAPTPERARPIRWEFPLLLSFSLSLPQAAFFVQLRCHGEKSMHPESNVHARLHNIRVKSSAFYLTLGYSNLRNCGRPRNEPRVRVARNFAEF